MGDSRDGRDGFAGEWRRGRSLQTAVRVERFLLVGTVGLALNVLGLWILYGKFNLPLGAASLAAIALSMAATFGLNELWTWGDCCSQHSFAARAAFYFSINSVGMLINWQALLFLHGHQSLDYQSANIVGAAMAAVWNFLLNHFVTWRT